MKNYTYIPPKHYPLQHKVNIVNVHVLYAMIQFDTNRIGATDVFECSIGVKNLYIFCKKSMTGHFLEKSLKEDS